LWPFTNYLLTTMGPLTMMSLLTNLWANGIASARRINEVLDAEPEVSDAPDARPLPAHARAGALRKRQLSLFGRGGRVDGLVLEGIDLTAEPGQTVAILGATGAGKTTLVNLIPRFYDPTSGQVLDGVDLRTI
jgi:ATP-binding cassette, subfamily B, multidrug efflux pump